MIPTPDRRLRVFISSTLGELAEEREAAREAIEQIRLTPIMFEAGARDHSPRDVYRSYLEQSDVFIGIYWQSMGWAPEGRDLTGLEEEFAEWTDKPRLIYVKEPAPHRQPRLEEFLNALKAKADTSYRTFAKPEDLNGLLAQDLAMLLSEHFLQTEKDGPFPTGTVTFLFTDIEGSTLLLRRLGDAYADLLDQHHHIIRDSIGNRGGIEVDTAGDGFFVVFPSAVGAVGAAVDAQRTILEHAWPSQGMVRVRMGLHTGEGAPVAGRYVGIDVHRAARIGAAGHGGQILVSAATAHLLGDSKELTLTDLGLHRLKDLPADEHIFQVGASGLPDHFPALRSIDAARTNLLDKASTFIGREQEMATVVQLLETNRLVTFTGPGGGGKSRLATQIGKRLIPRFREGVWMVSLAPVRAEATIQACLDALGLHEQPGRELEETLVDFLQSGTRLIILDNCEHLLAPAGSLAARLVEQCRQLTMIATSREPLRVPGEVIFSVPPLALPPPEVRAGGDLESYDAVRLFVERAAAVRGGFTMDGANASDVVRLVRRLDGVPLALELAAARVGSMSAGQIADRLDRSFEVLRDRGTTSEARHRTLTAAVDWSHGLLSHEEQVVFRRLSVFRGTFELEVAESVAADDGIDASDVADLVSSLVDRSMLVAEGGTGGYRYRMLEIIRQYAAARLAEAGEEEAIRERHSHWYRTQIGPALWPVNPTTSWYAARLTEYHNLEAAHDWLLSTRRASEAIEMAVALGWFWYNEGYWTEGRTRTAQSLALLDGTERLEQLRSQANVVAALLSFRQGDYEESLRLALLAEKLASNVSPTLSASARTTQALALIPAEKLEDASRLADSVLAEARGLQDDWMLGAVLIGVGRVALARGDFVQAAAVHREAAAVMAMSEDPWGLATAWEGVGVSYLYQGDQVAAARAFEKSLEINPVLGHDKASISTVLLGACRLGGEDDREARRLIDEGADVIFRRRDWVGRSFLMAGVVPALVKHQCLDTARRLIETDLAIARSTGDLRGRCRSLGSAARYWARMGDNPKATALAQELLDIRIRLAEVRQTIGALCVAAEVVLAGGSARLAARIWGAAQYVLDTSGSVRLPIEDLQTRELQRRLAASLTDSDMQREVAIGETLTLADTCQLAEQGLSMATTLA